jgi:hypothetical protein
MMGRMGSAEARTTSRIDSSRNDTDTLAPNHPVIMSTTPHQGIVSSYYMLLYEPNSIKESLKKRRRSYGE